MIVIYIRNKRDGVPSETYVLYVGRGSVLGNPFVEGRDGDRAHVIHLFRDWLAAQMNASGYERVDQMLLLIADRARKGDVALLCNCAPLPCHAEVIREAVCATFAGPEDHWMPKRITSFGGEPV